MKKLIVLLLFASCTVYKNQKTCHTKRHRLNTNIGVINLEYDSTKWKIVPMTKQDSLLLEKLNAYSNNE